MTMLISAILIPPRSNLLRTRLSTSSCPERKKSRRGTWSHGDDNGGDECIVPNESSHLHCLTSVSIARHLMEDVLYLLAFHVSSCGLPRVSPQLCQQTPSPSSLCLTLTTFRRAQTCRSRWSMTFSIDTTLRLETILAYLHIS